MGFTTGSDWRSSSCFFGGINKFQIKMKVLVVNAHADTQSGRSKFGEFQLKISRLLKDTIYYGSGQDEIVRSKDELDDLLYE